MLHIVQQLFIDNRDLNNGLGMRTWCGKWLLDFLLCSLGGLKEIFYRLFDLHGLFHPKDQGLQRIGRGCKGKTDQNDQQNELQFKVPHAFPAFFVQAWEPEAMRVCDSLLGRLTESCAFVR